MPSTDSSKSLPKEYTFPKCYLSGGASTPEQSRAKERCRTGPDGGGFRCSPADRASGCPVGRAEPAQACRYAMRPLPHPAWQGLAAMQDARPGRAIGGSLRRKTQTQSRHFARKDGATPFRRKSVSVLTGPEIQGLSADEFSLHPAPLCGSHPRQAWSTGT